MARFCSQGHKDFAREVFLKWKIYLLFRFYHSIFKKPGVPPKENEEDKKSNNVQTQKVSSPQQEKPFQSPPSQKLDDKKAETKESEHNQVKTPLKHPPPATQEVSSKIDQKITENVVKNGQYQQEIISQNNNQSENSSSINFILINDPEEKKENSASAGNKIIPKEEKPKKQDKNEEKKEGAPYTITGTYYPPLLPHFFL